MKKKVLAVAFILAPLLSVMAGTPFVSLGKSNPYLPIRPPVHPKITILSPEENTMHTSNALTITFNVSINFEKGWSSLSRVTYKASWQQDLIPVCEYPPDSKSLSEFSHKLNLTGIPEGKQTVWIYAHGRGGYQDKNLYLFFDDAYNLVSISFTIDTIPPNVSVLSVENKTYGTSGVPLNFTVSEKTAWIGYSLDGQTNVSITGNTTLTGLPEGPHSLVIYAEDTARNTGASETIFFTIDTNLETDIPEFPSWIILPLLITATLLILICKQRLPKTANK